MQQPPLDDVILLPSLAPCEHIAGNEKFILKAFELQKQYLSPSGPSLVDVTVDLEDGAPVGSEDALQATARNSLLSPANSLRQAGVRVHAFDSPYFASDIAKVVLPTKDIARYITIPKVQSKSQLIQVWDTINRIIPRCSIPLHVLIETPTAVREVNEIAALPFVQVLDFGLMDFISHLGGGIAADCMRSPGQFDHHILAKVKTEITFAALSHGKIASHNVTVDLQTPSQAESDATRARKEFGFLRMWSIHPAQIPQIITAMMPSASEVAEAKQILAAGEAAAWGPSKVEGRLHDRASYRYYWSVVRRSGAA